MTLLALWQRVRPWQETDTCIVAIILTLLLLLVIFKRGRSFLANGVFVGCALGSLCAFISADDTYSTKMAYVEWGIILGLLLGGAAKSSLQRLPQKQPELAATATKSCAGDYHGPTFWVPALSIAGISVGLTLALLFGTTYQEMIFWIGGLLLTSCVIGIAAGPVSKKVIWVQASLELWIVVALATGIGAVVGWKFVSPIILFDMNLLHISSEVLFRVAVCSCAGAGAFVGGVAWTARALRRKWARV